MKATNLLICFIVTAILVSISSTSVFAQETIEDCLKFSCPTIPGANYPEDCKIYVEYNGQTYYLVFDNSTQYLRDMLDEYYSESFSKCIKIKVTGDLQAQACSADDPVCVPTYEIKVSNVSIIEEFNITNETIGKPDLLIDKIEYELDNEANPTKLFYYIKIINNGDVESSFFDVNVQIPQLSMYMQNLCTNKNLLPGESCTEKGYGYRSDDSSIAGLSFTITAIVDPRNEIDELDETNNKKAISGTISIEKEEEGEIITNETIPIITEPIEEGIYGIYATLGEKFKLQETQPVKIIDYLDKNNNPLRIYLLDINKEDKSIKCQVLFGDESEIVKIPIEELKNVFGVSINFVSIDKNWEYATLQVEQTEIPPEKESIPICKCIGSKSEGWYNDTGLIKYDNCKGCKAVCKYTDTEKEGWYSSCTNERIRLAKCKIVGGHIAVKTVPIEKPVAVRATKALTTLEEVKTTVPKQAIGIEIAQEKILNATAETAEFEQKIKQRGITYKLKWFFGMVAEQEKQDAEFLNNQGQKLIETADLLLQISEQVGEPAKSVLIEQANSLREQAEEILEKAENKEKSAKGFLSWFGLK